MKENHYICKGLYTLKGNMLSITEIPPQLKIPLFKNKLNKKLLNDIIIKWDYISTSNIKQDSFRVDIVLSKDYMSEPDFPDCIEKDFKLNRKISYTNMRLFDSDLKIKKYKSVQEIFDEYFVNRLIMYEVRKKHHIEKLLEDIDILRCKYEFIKGNIDERIIIRGKSDEEIIESIESEISNVYSQESSINSNNLSKYSYLVKMPIRSLSHSMYILLRKRWMDKKRELEEYKQLTIEYIWEKELNELYRKLKAICPNLIN